MSRQPVGAIAKATVLPMLSSFLSRGKRLAASKPAADDMHELRVAAKKLRYTVELFAPVASAPLDGWMEKMKALQNVLGSISDCEAVRALVKRAGGHHSVQSALRRKARKKIGEFQELWAASASDIGSVQEALGEPAARHRAAHAA